MDGDGCRPLQLGPLPLLPFPFPPLPHRKQIQILPYHTLRPHLHLRPRRPVRSDPIRSLAMALWLGVPEPPPQQHADLFDEFAPAEDEAEADEDEMEEDEEEDDEDEALRAGFISNNHNELTLSVAGGEHVFLSASPDKVEAALSVLRGRELPVPPASGNELSMSYWREEYKFDSVTADEVQDVLLWLGGREMMVRRIAVLLSFQGVPNLFVPVSHYKVQAALSLLAGMELTVHTVVPPAWASWRKQPLHCEIRVSHSASPDKVQAALSLLGGRELNPGIGGGAPYRSFLQSISSAW